MRLGRTIGKLAEEAGVHVETIRYYERRGILQQPDKPSSGWRLYDEQALRTLRFVKRAQRLGFTLDEIEELLRLRSSDAIDVCPRVKARAEAKLRELRERLEVLEKARAELESIAAGCDGEEGGVPCQILLALESQ